MSKDIRKEFSDVIYPTMVIRTQAETIELQEKEIERLKSRLEEYQEYVKINHKEIEKLNNIINELERKMLNDKLYVENISKKQPYPIEEFRIRNPYTTGSYDTCINYLDKLQKLKGNAVN